MKSIDTVKTGQLPAADWRHFGLMVSVWILGPTLTWTIIGAAVWWLVG